MDRRHTQRPRRPASLDPSAADALVGGPDPAERIEAAHATAAALVRHARTADAEETARLVALADHHGIEEVARLWADRPADTLPGALWRLYALRDGIRSDPAGLARAFEAGRWHAPVHEVVAGVGQPPGADEVLALADAILAGAFHGDLADALDRAGAFCRVVATGWAVLADDAGAATASALTRRAADLVRTGTQLERAAAHWRVGELH